MKRRTAILLMESRKIINLSGKLSSVLGVASFIIAFAMQYPNSTGLEKYNLTPYTIMNISIWIIVFIVLFWIIYFVVWLIVRNAPPLAVVDVHSWKNEAYLRVKNDEPSDLDYVDIKIGALKRGNNIGNSLEHLGHNNIIKIEKRIITGEKVEGLIASGESGYTKFRVDDGLYDLVLNGRENEKTQGKYKIAFEVFVHPKKEEKSLLAGRYIGTIQHISLNGLKTKNGVSYGDTVFWENNIIQKVTEKQYKEFVYPEENLKANLIPHS